MSSRVRGFGLDNLIAGVLPDMEGWDTTPTDAANIVDGKMDTACTTGTKTLSAGFQYGYFSWEFPECCVHLAGMGTAIVSAGTARLYGYIKNGDSWYKAPNYLSYYGDGQYIPILNIGGLCTGIRIGVTGTEACNLTIAIGNMQVWRLC